MRAGAVLTVVLAGACGDDLAPPPAPDAQAADELPGATASSLDWPEDLPLPPEFETPPWLTMPAPGRVVVGWRTVEETGAEVVVEPAGGEPRAIPVPPATLHHADLGPLPAATTVRYRVELASGAAREGVFTTPGHPEWRFVHIAEFHAPTESDQVARFAEEIRGFRPQLLVESGDMMNDGDDDEHWVDYLRTSRPWISNVILLPAHSNHVNGIGGNPLLRSMFELPGNERWYTTRFGAVELVTLDSTYTRNPDTATEPAWIQDSMAAARAGADPPLFTVAAWHYPACSSHYASRTESRRWVMDHLVAAFVAAGGVDLILVGHDKYYERSILTAGGERIWHLMTNAGKLSPSAAGDNEPECAPIVTDTDTRSIALVGVAPDRLEIRVVDQEGRIGDELTVEPRAAR